MRLKEPKMYLISFTRFPNDFETLRLWQMCWRLTLTKVQV